MGFLRHRIVRGMLFVLGVVVWLWCVWEMGRLASSWVTIALEPPYKNKLAGVAWFFSGPFVLVGLMVASVLLYTNWKRFDAAAPKFARMTIATIVFVVGAFTAGFFIDFYLPVAVLMVVALVIHVAAMLGLIGLTFLEVGAPWNVDDDPPE